MPHVPAAALVALVGLHQCTCILIQALSCPRCPLRALVVHFVVASSISKVLKCSNHSFIKFRSCVFYRCRSQYISANSNVHGNTSTPAARRRMCFSHHGVVPLYSVLNKILFGKSPNRISHAGTMPSVQASIRISILAKSMAMNVAGGNASALCAHASCSSCTEIPSLLQSLVGGRPIRTRA